MDRIGVMAEVVVGKLLQLLQLGADGGASGEVGVEGGGLGVHLGLREVIDDKHMNAVLQVSQAIPASRARRNSPKNTLPW